MNGNIEGAELITADLPELAEHQSKVSQSMAGLMMLMMILSGSVC